MYLKSISIENYRRFQKKQTFEFAHSNWSKDINKMTDDKKEEETERYISKSTSLLVGKNNAGKSTVITLLNELQSKKCGSRAAFKCTDFNLNYLHKWYDKYILNTSNEIEDLPFMEFELKLGIDDGNDTISDFKDVLVIGGINDNSSDDEVAEVSIRIRYEVADEKKFKDEIKRKVPSEKQNRDEFRYRRFLSLFNENYYVLNFYPLGSTEPAKQFSLAPLLKVDTVEANTVKDDDTLSKAYSKIVSSYAKNNNLDNINDIVDDLNFRVKNMVDKNVKDILQNAVSAVESIKNLQMNLIPDVTLEKIFANNIIYEYHENDNDIPETQYGMGYTNLMMIIANIVDYIELYKEDDIHGSINILCIEEPESFMHPQMQELFIRNIAKAIARLLGEKDEFDTFQILITTHSSHILNSKIQSGNSLDNIIYLGSPNGENIVKCIKDEDILGRVKNGDTHEIKMYEYIKKYLRLEATDLFFADAIILVEGISEETYVRYLVDSESNLNNYHIKVYRIDGAYAHKFISLLKLIKIKTVILTDLDLKRRKEEDDNGNPKVIINNIKNLERLPEGEEDCLTTNMALRNFITEEANCTKKSDINKEIIETIGENEYLKFNLPETNISIYSQGKINGSYATSFEEAVILTNGKENKENLITLLNEVHPQRYSSEKIGNENFLDNSFKYQYEIGIAQRKEKFSTGLVYCLVNEDNFSIEIPQYISVALQDLSKYFEE